jgi:hypothetical protein
MHVLGTASREATARLERTPPANLAEAFQNGNWVEGPAKEAFDKELRRLHLVLRTLGAGRYIAAYSTSGKVEFALRLPDEPPGAAVRRNLREFVLVEMKEPLAWCRQHAGGYASPYLGIPEGHFGLEDPGTQPRGQARTLGQVLVALKLDTDEALQQYIKDKAKP